MKIRRIAIRNFRKLVGPVTIDGLEDGLTVIAGDNEEGKSTVLTAIQTALFDRHNLGGEAGQAMQPFGSAVRPEIEIDFDLGGQRYGLRKAFCQKPEAELTAPTGRFSGDAAEDRLRELLRFDPAKKLAVKPEQRGVWGLFWVEQGTSFARPQLKGSGRETLVDALESEVGQVLGGERGRALVAAITKRRDEYFTKPGKPRGDYKDSQDRVQMLETEVHELRSQLRQYDDKVDDLGRVRNLLRAYQDHRSLETAERDLKRAQEDGKRIDALRSALAAAEMNEQLAAAESKAALQSWTARKERIASAKRAGDEVAVWRATTLEKEKALADVKAEKDKAETAFASAKSDLARAEATLTASERDVQRARVNQEVGTLTDRLKKAKQSKREGDALRAEAATIRINQKTLAELRGLEKSADLARIRLQTIATRLELFPEPGREARLEDVVVAADQPLLLTEPARLALEGFGGVTVTPGGEDLSSRRNDAESAADTLAKALERHGIADTSAADKLFGKRADLLMKAARHDATVKAHAPAGIDILEREIERKSLEFGDRSEGGTESTSSIEEAEKRRDDAHAKFEEAKRTRDRAEDALKLADRLHAKNREDWVGARAELEAAERRAKQLEQELEGERAERSDDELRAAVEAGAGKHDVTGSIAAQRRADVDNANPEEVRLRLERAEQALETIRADIDKLSGQATVLETELRTLGQIGLGEQLEEKEGELIRARTAADRLERSAAAVRLLLDTLTAAEREAKETFLGPVRERIKPYLRLLFPDAELVLADDDMAISHLRRGGIDEPFESLSIGTREQLAVLTRLAFADFLRDKGRPAAIILDDALAYSDDQRFDRMQLVLRKAAERLQVIILTCRERDYHALGAPIVRLSDCGVP
jgi:DNA repair exonuclease SbcCD ATPase subunit